MRRIASVLVVALAGAMPAAAQTSRMPERIYDSAPLGDHDLAKVTGKFLLPNGVELALSIVSDTVVNGQLLLRTVLTVDNGAQLVVYGRTSDAAGPAYVTTAGAGAGAGAGSAMPTGFAINLDRHAGLSTITPTFTATQSAAPTVSVGAIVDDSKALGLSALPVTLGGPGVATPDGVVSLQAVRNGTQVTLVGDQLAVANLVGQSIASAVVNSGDNRSIDTVTNVAIDMRNVLPYQIGSAQVRVDTLALDAARGMVR